MRTIFHIATKKEWAEAQEKGFYRTRSLEKEGFIHFSRPQQVQGVSERHFKGAKDLVLLEIEQELIKGELKYEGAEYDKFPHLYAQLNLDSIKDSFDMDFSDKPFTFPAKYKLLNETLIRPAVISDAAELANVHLNAWRESYQNIVPENYLDRLPLSFRGRQKFWEYLLKEAKDSFTFVAESADNGIVGFSSVGDARDSDYEGWGELAAIYLLKQFKNKKIGTALLQVAFEKLKSRNFENNYCWVLENNSTIEFYEKLGAIKGLGKKTIEREIELTEISMEWKKSTDL